MYPTIVQAFPKRNMGYIPFHFEALLRSDHLGLCRNPSHSSLSRELFRLVALMSNNGMNSKNASPFPVSVHSRQ